MLVETQRALKLASWWVMSSTCMWISEGPGKAGIPRKFPEEIKRRRDGGCHVCPFGNVILWNVLGLLAANSSGHNPAWWDSRGDGTLWSASMQMNFWGHKTLCRQHQQDPSWIIMSNQRATQMAKVHDTIPFTPALHIKEAISSACNNPHCSILGNFFQQILRWLISKLVLSLGAHVKGMGSRSLSTSKWPRYSNQLTHQIEGQGCYKFWL